MSWVVGSLPPPTQTCGFSSSKTLSPPCSLSRPSQEKRCIFKTRFLLKVLFFKQDLHVQLATHTAPTTSRFRFFLFVSHTHTHTCSVQVFLSQQKILTLLSTPEIDPRRDRLGILYPSRFRESCIHLCDSVVKIDVDNAQREKQ